MWGEEAVLPAASSAYFLIQEGAARQIPWTASGANPKNPGFAHGETEKLDPLKQSLLYEQSEMGPHTSWVCEGSRALLVAFAEGSAGRSAWALQASAQ